MSFLLATIALVGVIGRYTEPVGPARPACRRGVAAAAAVLVLYAVLSLHAFTTFGLQVLPGVQGALGRLVEGVSGMAEPIGVPSWAVPVVLFVSAAVLVCRLAGASWKSLGFCRGKQLTIAIGVPAVPLVLAIVAFVALGRLAGSALPSLLGVGVAVAATEELFFRGCLLTRLEHCLGSAWSLVLSALLFGVFHTGMLVTMAGLPLSAAVAMGVLQQGVLGGLLLGFVFQRSRTLLAPIVLHALGNVALSSIL